MTLTPPQAALLTHFLDDYQQRLGSAGCNDMDMEAFSGMTQDDFVGLLHGFSTWDRFANPEDPPRIDRPVTQIMDYEWVAYLADVISEVTP